MPSLCLDGSAARRTRRLLVLAAAPLLLASLVGETPLHVLVHLEHLSCSCALAPGGLPAGDSSQEPRGQARLEEPTPDHECGLCAAGTGLGTGIRPTLSLAPFRTPETDRPPVVPPAASSLPPGSPAARGPPSQASS